MAATVLSMAEQTTDEPPKPATPPSPIDDLVTTHHQLVTPSGTLAYAASAGRVVLREEVQEDGVFRGFKPKAEVFVVSYVADSSEPGVTSGDIRLQWRPWLVQRVASPGAPRPSARPHG